MLAQTAPDVLLDIAALGLTTMLWQMAVLVRAARGARLLRWSVAVQLGGLVPDGVWRATGALGHHSVGVALLIASIVISLVGLALMLAGVAAVLRDLWPRRPRRRRGRAPASA